MVTNSESAARLRKAVDAGARRSGRRAAIFLGLGLVGAAAAAFLITRYMDQRVAGVRVATKKVVVAAKDLPLASTLTADSLSTVDWPVASHIEGSASDLATVVGRVAIVKITRGEPILESKLASRDAGAGLAAVLPPEMRAVAVRVDDVVGVAGFIHPGDSVDVIVTMRAADSGTTHATSKVILQNVRVLAVGKHLESDEKASKKSVEATVATLMVDSSQAERLALAAVNGKLLLALRSNLDGRVVETTGVLAPTLFSSAGPPEPARPGRPRPAAEPPKTPDEVVEILRGDRFEEKSMKERPK